MFIYICHKASAYTPHVIKHSNFSNHLSRYPFDYVLFHPNEFCHACCLTMPARSRHCSRCGVCVARADHHCVWVDGCIDYGNYKYFLGLLLSMTLLLVYAASLAYITVAPEVRTHLARQAAVHSHPAFGSPEAPLHSDREAMASLLWIWDHQFGDTLTTAFLVGGVSRCGVGLLALATAPLPAMLLMYHMYLIWKGMTTYESGKWKNWSKEIDDGLAFTARITDGSERSQREKCKWPKRSKHLLVYTIDGLPPRHLPPQITEVVGGRVEWQPCRSVKELENIYNLGFCQNLREVLLS